MPYSESLNVLFCKCMTNISRCFSVFWTVTKNAIASFLEVDSSEIHSILKKELVDYKEKILHQIDQAIELETSEKPYVKKLKKDITE